MFALLKTKMIVSVGSQSTERMELASNNEKRFK
jgi:hypothetical protein